MGINQAWEMGTSQEAGNQLRQLGKPPQNPE